MTGWVDCVEVAAAAPAALIRDDDMKAVADTTVTVIARAQADLLAIRAQADLTGTRLDTDSPMESAQPESEVIKLKSRAERPSDRTPSTPWPRDIVLTSLRRGDPFSNRSPTWVCFHLQTRTN